MSNKIKFHLDESVSNAIAKILNICNKIKFKVGNEVNFFKYYS